MYCGGSQWHLHTRSESQGEYSCGFTHAGTVREAASRMAACECLEKRGAAPAATVPTMLKLAFDACLGEVKGKYLYIRHALRRVLHPLSVVCTSHWYEKILGILSNTRTLTPTIRFLKLWSFYLWQYKKRKKKKEKNIFVYIPLRSR